MPENNSRREDRIQQHIRAMCERVEAAKEAGLYFFNLPATEIRGGAHILLDGREMSMFASYSYLGLLGHPRINAAAKAAIDEFGTGTHGVRTLAGTISLHRKLEEKIAEFKGTDDSLTFSSGYVTNLTTISSLVGRHDVVLCDKLNHASIVDGCMLSGADFVRFRHNDMQDLEKRLREVPGSASKLVVVDAVFSMDGDIVDLPRLAEICRRFGAWLMVDEAHSVGVLGDTGHGIEEHFHLPGVIDIKMGTLSKTIPSIGGYIAGSADLVRFLRHASRAYIFSAALPPAQTAAAYEAFRVIEDEPWRVQALRKNSTAFTSGLKSRGLDTMKTETAIVPIFCGRDEPAYVMTREAHRENVFVLPVVSPAVPEGMARLRSTVTAAHSMEDIHRAVDVFERAAKVAGIL